MKQTKKKLLLVTFITAIPLGILGYFSIKKLAFTKFYTVEFDTNGGTPIAPLSVEYGKKITTELVTNKDGYYLDHWMNGGNVWRLDKDVVTKDISLKASWEIATYNLTYNFDGGSYSGSYQTQYDMNSDFDLIRPQKNNAVFGGWFINNGKRIDAIKPKTMYGDLVLNAAWISNLYVESTDKTKGNIYAYLNESNTKLVTLKNAPVNNRYHLFKGWYDENGNLLSTESIFEIALQDGVQTKVYSRYLSSNEETEWNNQHGVNPIFVEEDKVITYGLYPQSNVSDEILISKLETLEETRFCNYVYYDGEYYLNHESNVIKDSSGGIPDYCRFNNNKKIEDKTNYWFKVEPIRWRVLKNDLDGYLVISEKLLETCRFHNIYTDTVVDGITYPPNSYNTSYLRKWLNGEFSKKAFYFNDGCLTTNEINMGAETTSNPDYSTDFQNIFDKVYILSFSEYLNSSFGFANVPGYSPTRFVDTSDYTRTTGCSFGYEGGKHSGYYWTRSMFYSESNNITVSKINKSGVINTTDVKDSAISNQPVIKIVLG